MRSASTDSSIAVSAAIAEEEDDESSTHGHDSNVFADSRSADENRIVCIEGDACLQPRGKEKFNGAPCTFCTKWVHRVCATKREMKNDYTCYSCYVQQNKIKRLPHGSSNKIWRQDKEKIERSLSPTPPPDLLDWDPTNSPTGRHAAVNVQLYELYENNSSLTLNQYHFFRAAIIRRNNLSSKRDEEYDTANVSEQLIESEDQRTKRKMTMGSDGEQSPNRKKAALSTNVESSSKETISVASLQHSVSSIQYVVVDVPFKGLSDTELLLPFTLVVVPDDCVDIVEELKSPSNFTKLVPTTVDRKMFLDHIVWKESGKRLTGTGGKAIVRLSETEQLEADGRVSHQSLLKILGNMTQIKGADCSSTVLDLVSRCSMQWQKRLVRLANKQKNSCASDSRLNRWT
jgi:hypothetical protein